MEEQVEVKDLGIQPQELIVEKYREVSPVDPLGFESGEYMLYMDYTHVEEFLQGKHQNEETRKEWDETARTVEVLLKAMEEYMSFAWDKANNFRGLSADRSIRHYVAWTWLIGDEEFSKKIGDAVYEFYGKDILVMICERYGWDHLEEWDDGVRKNSEGY